MDLPAVRTLITPADRNAIPSSGLFVAGGTWIFSEPQLETDTLVDLRSLGWPAITVRSDGLDVAATATIAELAAFDYPRQWTAAPLFDRAAKCLLASFKVLAAATIGGNIALAYPAGALIAVAVALDAEVVIWRADGRTELIAARDVVLGSGRTVLGRGDLIRSLHFSGAALSSPWALRKAALADRGRSGVLLIGTGDRAAPQLTVTAATAHPVVLGPGTDWGRADAAIDPALFVDDEHGAADWRAAVVRVLAAEIATELGWNR